MLSLTIFCAGCLIGGISGAITYHVFFWQKEKLWWNDLMCKQQEYFTLLASTQKRGEKNESN
jgi:hypothetical protein